MKFDDVYWIIWLVVIFLPYEVYAALSKTPGDTLSENVWDWFAVKHTQAKYGKLRRFVLWGFITALASHFIYATTVIPVIVFGVGIAWAIYYHYAHEVNG